MVEREGLPWAKGHMRVAEAKVALALALAAKESASASGGSEAQAQAQSREGLGLLCEAAAALGAAARRDPACTGSEEYAACWKKVEEAGGPRPDAEVLRMAAKATRT